MTELSVWRIAVESEVWVGPLSVKLSGVEVTYPWQTQLVLRGEFPDDDAWVDPITDPLNVTAGKGFQCPKVNLNDAGTYDLCVLINADVTQKPVLREVATVVRY